MKRILFTVGLSLLLAIGCQNNPKKEKETPKTVEVKVEKTDSLTKATVITKRTENGQVSEEIQVFEGTHEEVMEKVSLLTEDSKSEAEIVRKTVKKVQFQLDPKSGSSTQGKVTLTEEDGKVTFEANISGLNEGVHAIHIHQKADCSSDDGKSSGGHWNPTFEDHGAWGSETGFHRGDIGNFDADSSGSGTVVFSTDLWCLDCDDPVKNVMGKAVIVHQGEDDLVSQPSGAAGARISCAGIIY
jgi:Cu-Zn family superoxide dismutase